MKQAIELNDSIELCNRQNYKFRQIDRRLKGRRCGDRLVGFIRSR